MASAKVKNVRNPANDVNLDLSKTSAPAPAPFDMGQFVAMFAAGISKAVESVNKAEPVKAEPVKAEPVKGLRRKAEPVKLADTQTAINGFANYLEGLVIEGPLPAMEKNKQGQWVEKKDANGQRILTCNVRLWGLNSKTGKHYRRKNGFLHLYSLVALREYDREKFDRLFDTMAKYLIDPYESRSTDDTDDTDGPQSII